MLSRPDIQTKIIPNENVVRVNFDPVPEDHHIYELAEWMERVPGIISANPGIGSIALRAAHPPIPLEACRAEAQIVADTYFDCPQEKIQIIDSPYNYVRSQELRRVFLEHESSGSFQAQRHHNREFEPADLFIMTNSQVPERQSPRLSTAIMDNEESVYSALVVDNGYGLQMRILDVYIGYEPKDEIADRVISLVSQHTDFFRQVFQKSVKK